MADYDNIFLPLGLHFNSEGKLTEDHIDADIMAELKILISVLAEDSPDEFAQFLTGRTTVMDHVLKESLPDGSPYIEGIGSGVIPKEIVSSWPIAYPLFDLIEQEAFNNAIGGSE